ncbi:MAG: glycosyltransferase [Candidatus Izemoplasmatales bacterium]|jgi:glycosyltransferase involved in cell wall biosynthesis
MADKKLRIGFFVDVFFPMIDGVVVVIDNYAKRLSETAEVIVFAPSARNHNYIENRPYRVVRSQKIMVMGLDYDLSMPFMDLKFQKELAHANLDIVHIHSPFGIGIIGINYAKKHHIPVVGTIHSQYYRDFLQKTKSHKVAELMNKQVISIYNKCDECWTVNQTIIDLYRGFGIKKPMLIHKNATDFEPLPQDRDMELRKQLAITEDDHIFLFVGRLEIVKNIYFLLDALISLHQSGNKFKMLFIGTGPETDEIKTRISRHGMEDIVLMLGRVEDRMLLARYYRLAELFLFPSLYDTNSLVQIEAASQKTPTVFLEGAATAALVINRQNGFLSPDDPEQFAQLITNILADKNLYAQVSEGCFRDLYRPWNDTVKGISLRYRQLVASYALKK